MTGIYWEYKNYEKSEKYWGLTSYQYKCLGNLFLDFEFKYNQSLSERTYEFLLSKDQKSFLISGIKKELKKLLFNFNHEIIGLNSITKTYNGIDYKLYYKSSRSHRLISRLISFHDYLDFSIQNDIDLMCCGIENNEKKLSTTKPKLH